MMSLSLQNNPAATVPDCGAAVNLLQPSFRGDRALARSNPESRGFAPAAGFRVRAEGARPGMTVFAQSRPMF